MCLGLSHCDGPFIMLSKRGVLQSCPVFFVPRHPCKVVRCRVCADGSFACAGFALLRGPLVAYRFAALGPVSGNAASMLIRTSARTSPEQSLQGCRGQSPEQSLQYRPSSRNYNQKSRRNATVVGFTKQIVLIAQGVK